MGKAVPRLRHAPRPSGARCEMSRKASLSGAISQMFIGGSSQVSRLFSHLQRRLSHVQRWFPSCPSSLVEASHEVVQWLAVELPMEGEWRSVVKLLELRQPLCDRCQRAQVVRCEDLALHERKRDCHVMEPTRLHRRMPHDGIGVLRLKPLHRTFPTVRRAGSHQPNDPIGVTIGLWSPPLIDHTLTHGDPCCGCTTTQHPAAHPIPGRHLLQGTPALVCRFDAQGCRRSWGQTRLTTATGLETRLFVATEHASVAPQRLAWPEAGVPIPPRSRVGAQAGSAWEHPVTIPPRLAGLPLQRPPDGRLAQRALQDGVDPTGALRRGLPTPRLLRLGDEGTGRGRDGRVREGGKSRACVRGPASPQGKNPCWPLVVATSAPPGRTD